MKNLLFVLALMTSMLSAQTSYSVSVSNTQSSHTCDITRTSVSISEDNHEYKAKASFSNHNLGKQIEATLVQELGSPTKISRGKQTWSVNEAYKIELKKGKLFVIIDKEKQSKRSYEAILSVVDQCLAYFNTEDVPSPPIPPSQPR